MDAGSGASRNKLVNEEVLPSCGHLFNSSFKTSAPENWKLSALKDFCPQDLTWLTVWIRLLIHAGILEAYFKMNFTKNKKKILKRGHAYSFPAYIIGVMQITSLKLYVLPPARRVILKKVDKQ